MQQERLNMHQERLEALSMGHGQEEAARSMLLDGLQKGRWV